MPLKNLTLSDIATTNWHQCSDVLQQAKIHVSAELALQAQEVFTLSDFVANQCLRSSDLLIELLKEKRFDRSLSLTEMQSRLQQLLIDVTSEQQLMQVLRLFRNRQMVAIYWRDLLDIAEVAETCQQTSFLADVCIQQTLQWLYKKQCQELAINLKQPTEPLNEFVVLGMGKLGGNELNVSSDIDLIFCYQNNTNFSASNRCFEAGQFYNQLARKLILCLDKVSKDGFVFRVDMRLRPYGDSGPLVMSFAAIEEYYQDQGRDWERFAMIKARAITGSASNIAELETLLRPFIFRRYIDYSVLESPRQMKNLINQELRRRNLHDNIKLGPGGIREVEFIAQALQLIHGGRETSLQCRSIFQSLPRLAELNLIAQSDADELMNCYLFLRKVEHRLQAKKDRQTQSLPLEENDRLQLSQGLGYENYQSLHDAITNTMNFIHGYFNETFKDQSLETTTENEREGKRLNSSAKSPIIFSDIWQDFTSMDSNINALLLEAGFENVDEIAKLLSQFQSSSSVKNMGPRGAKRLAQLMPSILQSILHQNITDFIPESMVVPISEPVKKESATAEITETLKHQVSAAEQQAQNLKRILTLLNSINRRTAYLELLAQNKAALEQMIKLCSASARIAEQITDYPYVLDELINPNSLFHPPEISQFPDMLRQLLCRIPEDDAELQMDCLREFRQINLLRVTAADIVDALSMKQVSRYLTAIAETIIEAVVNLAWQQLSIKHGIPSLYETEDKSALQSSESLASKKGFAIIAYGKLGGQELGYSSDLDLVFLHDAVPGMTDGEKPIENAIFYMRLAQKIIHFLSIRTRSGLLYEVDMRLRPSGNSGLLVSHIDAFVEYQNNSAWTWEHQALIRTRCILGSVELRKQFEEIRTAIVCQQRQTKVLAGEVVEMREKMRDTLLKKTLNKNALYDLKQSVGGIADIEFLTQYLVLKLSSNDSTLAISSNTTELLSSLARKEKLSDPRLKVMVKVYAELRRLVNKNALQNQNAVISLKQVAPIALQTVEDLWRDMLLGDAQI